MPRQPNVAVLPEDATRLRMIAAGLLDLLDQIDELTDLEQTDMPQGPKYLSLQAVRRRTREIVANRFRLID